MKYARNCEPQWGSERQNGQSLVVFVLALVMIMGFVALAIDVGMAYREKSNLQSAADSAALAAAGQLAANGSTSAAISQATTYLQKFGYQSPQQNISVNIPPTSGAHTGDPNFVEVKVANTQSAIFRAPLDNSLWNIGARAVAGVYSDVQQPITFAALRNDCKSHTLLIQAGGTFTVNGGIYVNSCNGLDGKGKGADPPGYGDAFDIFGAGGQINAQWIKVVGGWETHNNTTASPDPLIHQPVLTDPLAGLAAPDPNTLTVRNGTASHPSQLKITGGTTTTLQPGVYYGGIVIQGNANVTLADGIYYIGGGGFIVTGNATLNAPHVMIYNTRTSGRRGDFNVVSLDSSSSITLGPISSGVYKGMAIFQDRNNDEDITIDPGNGINGLSGTWYAANDDASVVVTASGTANVQIVAGMINVVGADTTFQYQAGGLFGGGVRLTE